MAAIAELKAILGIDNAQYKAGMRDSEGVAKRFQGQIASIGRTLGVAFSVGGILAATRSVVNLASELRHSADNLSVNTDELQALNAHMLRYGVNLESVSKSLGKVKQAQGELVSGGDSAKTYSDALVKLGIDQQKFIDSSPAEAMAMIGRAYSDAGESAAAYSGIMDIMGSRVAKELTAALKDLGETGLQTVIDKAKEAGMVMDDALITKLELLGTKNEQIILRMKVGWASFLNVVGNTVSAVAAMSGEVAEQQKRMSWGERIKDALTFGPARRLFSKEAIAAGARAINGPDKPPTPLLQPKDTKPTNYTQTGADASAMVDAYTKNKERLAKLAAAEQDLIDKYGERIALERNRSISVSPQGTNADSMARVGGMVGQSRAGLGIADRQLKIQMEGVETNKRIEALNREMNDALQSMRDAQNGGLP